jgi:Flp pilus assembly protein CpaB
MRRGRIFIYLALIIILAVGAGAYYLFLRPKAAPTPAAAQVTPQVQYVGIITAGQNISAGMLITDGMLSSIQIPQNKLVQGLFTNKGDVVNLYAKISITQGVPITDAMVSVSPGNVNLPGSSWAPYIPEGMTAVAIPINLLSSAAYGIRDGDYVDVIASMLLVDVDPAGQTILPNQVDDVTSTLNPTTNVPAIKQGDVLEGHFEDTPLTTINPPTDMLLYVAPSENQRARLVTQMIMQDIQVLHVGTFPLPGESASGQSGTASAAGPTPTPLPGNQPPAAAVIAKPNIITLMVSPQDAVTLAYLVAGISNDSTNITLTLRNPNDKTPITQPDAAMLEYLLTQYNIPVPAKLPYSTQPRLDVLPAPKIPTDPTPQP